MNVVCEPYVSKSFLSKGAERQDNSNDGHSLQYTVHS